MGMRKRRTLIGIGKLEQEQVNEANEVSDRMRSTYVDGS